MSTNESEFHHNKNIIYMMIIALPLTIAYFYYRGTKDEMPTNIINNFIILISIAFTTVIIILYIRLQEYIKIEDQGFILRKFRFESVVLWPELKKLQIEFKQTSRSTTGILDMVMDGVQSAIDYGNEVGTIIITVFLPNKKLRYAFNNQKYDKLNQNLEIINRNLEIQPEITVNDDTTVFGRKWIWNRI